MAPFPTRRRQAIVRFVVPLLLAAVTVLVFILSEDLGGDVTSKKRRQLGVMDSSKQYPIDFHADLATNLNLVRAGPTPLGSNAVPFFWYIPMAGGANIDFYYRNCMGLKLHTDIKTRQGVMEAKVAGTVPSQYPDMFTSPLFHPFVDIFDAENKGRVFAMFRHPVEIAVNEYQNSKATWEQTYDPTMTETPLVAFANIEHRRDWITRNLAGVSYLDDLTQQDFDFAKEVLSNYILVGLNDRANESIERFDQFFGFTPVLCGRKDDVEILEMNLNEYPRLERGSKEWNEIEAMHPWDTKLFEFIKVLYEEQGNIFAGEVGQNLVERNLLASVDQNHSDIHQEGPGKQVLYALTNGEGLSGQLMSLFSYLHFAEATNRDLVIVPFSSEHYKDQASDTMYYIRIEDYVDNTTHAPVRWRTIDPLEDYLASYDMQMLNNAKEQCYFESRGCFHTPVHVNRINITENERSQFNIGKVCVGDRPDHANVTFAGLVEESNTKFDIQRSACFAGRGSCFVKKACELRNVSKVASSGWNSGFEPSAMVIEVTNKGLENMFVQNGLTPTADRRVLSIPLKYNAVHLRRGDKCSGVIRGMEYKSESLRCGPADQMPFLDLCRNTQSNKPMYVATAERDPTFIKTLRNAGCLLIDDLGIDFEEEARMLNERRGGEWKSVHASTLAYSVETRIVLTADNSYSMGCSSFYDYATTYRANRGFSKVKMYQNDLDDFVDSGILSTCEDMSWNLMHPSFRAVNNVTLS